MRLKLFEGFEGYIKLPSGGGDLIQGDKMFRHKDEVIDILEEFGAFGIEQLEYPRTKSLGRFSFYFGEDINIGELKIWEVDDYYFIVELSITYQDKFESNWYKCDDIWGLKKLLRDKLV